MDENFVNSNQASLALETAAAEVLAKKTGSKAKDFLIGLFFGLAGSIILALMDLLFIAMANTALDVLISTLVILGPVFILGLYVYFLIHYFKTRRFIFFGLLASFVVFLTLFTTIILLS